MSPDLRELACDSEAARLLPWFVNGRLSSADGERVARHVGQCAICRADLEHEQALRRLMKDDGPIEYAPQAGLAKTLARIDELEREAPGPLLGQRDRQPARRHAATTRWLVAAVIVQALGLGILGAALLQRGDDAEPARYRTLSSPPPIAAGAHIRAVFTPATTMSELGGILSSRELLVVAGPTQAGVFTLAPARPMSDARELDARLQDLRGDPHVLFAERADDGGGGAR